MATDPRERLDLRRQDLDDRDDELGERLLELSKALDERHPTTRYENGDGQLVTYAPRTITGYTGKLLRLAEHYDLDVLDVGADEINERMLAIKERDGLAGTTMASYQSALIALYRFHDDLGVDADAIDVDSEPANVRYDEQDLFTADEVWALREACRGSRDRALLELLIYTGQRIGAAVTLRASDVDLADDAVYLNEEYAEEHGGLKGALDRGRRRRLLGAKKPVADWLQYRPGDTDWLFVGDPGNAMTAEGDHLSPRAARATLRRIGERAGVDKPVKPHNFRHYAATTLRRDWGWTKDEIKAQLGLSETSTIFETTYSHITDSELIDAGAKKFHGEDDADAETSSTPPVCPSCSELLRPHYLECPNPSCTEKFGQDQAGRLEDELTEALGDLARANPDAAHELVSVARELVGG